MKNSDLQTKFEAYLLTERLVSQNTFSAYKLDVAQLVSFLDKKKIAIKTATLKQVKDFLAHLTIKLEIKPRSLTRKISTLKIFFTYLHDHFGYPNLGEDLIFPKVEQKLPQYLSEIEIQKLLDIADNDDSGQGGRNRTMLYLLYVSGMRVSELTNLNLHQLHFDTGFIRVLGKGGKTRMVPIPQPVMTLLKEYINNEHRAFTKNGSRKTDYLFPIFYGGRIKPITRQAFWTILKSLWKKTGIKRSISPHKLRHSLATHMLKNGVNLRSLQMILGHENLSTVQIYTHVETSYMRKIYDKKHPRS